VGVSGFSHPIFYLSPGAREKLSVRSGCDTPSVPGLKRWILGGGVFLFFSRSIPTKMPDSASAQTKTGNCSVRSGGVSQTACTPPIFCLSQALGKQSVRYDLQGITASQVMASINILTDIVLPLSLPRQAQVRSILNTVRDYEFSSQWLELRATMHADNSCGQATAPRTPIIYWTWLCTKYLYQAGIHALAS
jgi:hypothetical protein